MITKLSVDTNIGLRETEEKFHPALRGAAIFLSYLFHPVFVPVYVIGFLLFVQSFLFVGYSDKQKIVTLIQAILMYTFFPLISVALLRALKFINSIKLNDRKDRIIPFIICNIWYFWMWYVWRNTEMPREMVVFAMSAFFASSIGLLLNIYMKISLHAIAIGTAIAFLCGLSFHYNIHFGIYLSIAIFIGGAVCTARLILRTHRSAEIYWGIAAGVLAVLLANFFN